jgi:hypothetical protein
VNALYDQEEPDFVVSTLVDYFVPDLLHRIGERRGIPFIGVVGSAFQDRVMFMARGEHRELWSPSAEEIGSAVAEVNSPSFRPFLPEVHKESAAQFAKNHGRIVARKHAFHALIHLPKNRDSVELMINPERGSDYEVRAKDLRGTRPDSDWAHRLEKVDRRRSVFVALQYIPETTLDYFVEDTRFIDYEATLERVCRSLSSAGFQVVVKDHPNMFGYRRSSVFEAIRSAAPSAIVVASGYPSGQLIEATSAVFTVNGTAAFQAAVAGKIGITSNAYYASGDRYLFNRSFDDLTTIGDRLDFALDSSPANTIEQTVSYYLRSTLPGVADYLLDNPRSKSMLPQTANSLTCVLQSFRG